MKKILIICMFVFSTAAFANIKEDTNKNTLDNTEIGIKEDDNRVVKDSTKTKAKPLPFTKQISGDDARFDISVLIVDFINRNNIKIAKHLLED